MSQPRDSDGVFHRRSRLDFIGETRCLDNFPEVSDLDTGSSAGKSLRPLRICVVSDQIPDPDFFSRSGASFARLAETLAGIGHEVELLYVGSDISQREVQRLGARLKGHGVEFSVLGEASTPIQKGPSGMALEKAYNLYEYLKQRNADFDVVHAPDSEGLLFLCTQAKVAGLFFQRVSLVVHAVAPTLWDRLTNSEPINDVGDLAKLNIERRAVEAADFVVSPSQYMLRWMTDQSYHLPAGKTFVIPQLESVPAHAEIDKAPSNAKIDEIVFVGEVASAHGIHLMLDALLRSRPKSSANSFKSITILGPDRAGHDLSAQFAKVEKAYGFKINRRSAIEIDEIVKYLEADPARLTVMPAVANNGHDVLYACLQQAIPMLLTGIGIVPELLAEQAANCRVVEPLPGELAKAISDILEHGLPISEDAVSFRDNQSALTQFHHKLSLLADLEPNENQPQADIEEPLVSVCIAHHNRGKLLQNAIESVVQQSYQNIEIIVIDDGSEDPFSLAVLDNLEISRDHRFPIRVVRQPNRYLGAVRNTGITAARGKYILFMDDDNEAKPHEVETFVKVALHTGSEILTCLSDMFAGERPDSASMAPTRIVFHGKNLAMAMVRNPYGDSNCFVLRSYAEEIEGFSEHYKVGLDDMEFFTRAILSSAKLTLVPEALYWYRINEVRMRQGQYNLYAGRWRVSEAFTQDMHPDLANIVRYAMGMGYTHGPWAPPSGRRLSIGLLESGRRLVHRFPFLYPLARRVYRMLH